MPGFIALAPLSVGGLEGTEYACYSNQSHLDNVVLGNGVNLLVGFRQGRVCSLQRDLALRHIELLYTGPQM